MMWSVDVYFKWHSTDYNKPFEISHWDTLERLKSLLEWPMAATLSLESDKELMVGKTLKHLTELLGRLQGIGHGYHEGMESRSLMVPPKGVVHKLREELKKRGLLLFGPHILGILGKWRSVLLLITFLSRLYLYFIFFVLYWLGYLENQQCNKLLC